MKSQHIPMSIEAFDVMPRKLGWKYEYWDGEAHITPSHMSVVTASVTVEKRTVEKPSPCQYTLQTPSERDLSRLKLACVASFREAIDYCDYSLAEAEETAHRDLTTFFAAKRGTPMAASCMAVQNEAVIGAALIVEKPNRRPLLDLLFVVPAWHRKGIATNLVATALNRLHEAGFEELRSRYRLGNAESRIWHKHFGFKDEHNTLIAQAYYRHAAYEVERHQVLGDLSDELLEALIRVRDAHRNYLKALDDWAKKSGLGLIMPPYD